MIFRKCFKALIRRDLTYFNKRLTRKGLYEFPENEFSAIGPDEEVLSIGSGGGVNRLLSKYADKEALRVVSLDIDPSRYPDVVADLCEVGLGLDEGPFSTVVCAEVLEHCYDPFAAIANSHRNLKPGGSSF